MAFPLHPETPEEGLSLEELFAGRNIDVPALVAHLRKQAAELNLPFGERTRTYNSRRAQELGKWAEAQGRGEAFHEAVFKAYFGPGLNIARVEVLAEVARSVGLSGAEAEEVLAAGTFSEAVDRDWASARAAGVVAVPTFVAGGRVVVGAQRYETLEKLVQAAGATRALSGA